MMKFADKEYELYAPTRADRDQWIQLLKIIAEMNRQGIKLDSTTPLDYLRDQEQKTQKALEEAKMS